MVAEKSLPGVPPRNREPLLFHIAKLLERKHVRGSSRLIKSLHRLGWLDRPVDYRIGGSLNILVPIARNEYDTYEVEGYSTDFLNALAAVVNQVPGPFTLIDGGADIGIISVKLHALCPSITRIVAFEPNSEAVPWLKHNLGRLKIPTESFEAALADFEGQGELVFPEPQWSPGVEPNHTQCFLEPASGGPIHVTTCDALGYPPSENFVMKLDLEGGELAALRGASRTISIAANFIAAIEAHPDVTARTGIDPSECLRFLASLRPFVFTVSETGMTLDPNRPAFEQIISDHEAYNIIARTT